jgi:hypothetical protein
MSTNISILSPYESHNTIEGIENKRSYASAAAAILNDKEMPEEFPFHLWSEQSARYQDYWSWFTGQRLAQDFGETKDGKTVSKFPLQINVVRNAVRKLSALLFGEAPDTPAPLVKSVVKPKTSLLTGEANESLKKTAKFYQNILNEIWHQSHGNAIMYENGTMSQFLGGCYFKYEYAPPELRPDLRIPIIVKKLIPDFVMPIWNTEDEFELNEAWIVYRISKVAAKREYGLELGSTFANYVEHWTKKSYSVHIEGKPLKARYHTPYGEHVIDYSEQENPFGFVPIIYIPRLREGNFYGSSMVPDIAALTLEFNGRFADVGTLVHKLADRQWFGKNISGNPRPKQLDNGIWFTDLGMRVPSIGADPEVWAETAAEVSETLIKFNKSLGDQITKESNLADVAFGEVDGTQRSGETLKSLMWPATAIIRPQRNNWTTGKSRGDQMALDMLAAKGVVIEGTPIPELTAKDYDISQDWLPILPKDREQTINEIVSLAGVDKISIEDAVSKRGDSDDNEEEVARIKKQMEEKAEMDKADPPMQGVAATAPPNKKKPSSDTSGGDNK